MLQKSLTARQTDIQHSRPGAIFSLCGMAYKEREAVQDLLNGYKHAT